MMKPHFFLRDRCSASTRDIVKCRTYSTFIKRLDSSGCLKVAVDTDEGRLRPGVRKTFEEED